MKRVMILVTLGIVILLAVPNSAKGAGNATIPIEGCSWNTTSLTVRIIPGNSLASYQPSFLAGVLRGIRNWNQAFSVWIDEFGSPYIGAIQFVVFIDGYNQTTATTNVVTVSFVSSLSTDGSVLGVTHLTPYLLSPNICASATVQFATQDISSYTVMTSVASHEFGHVLGLDHASNLYADDGKEELMYALLADHQNVVFPSTLDVYALTQLFKWASSPSGGFYRPSSSSFSLPPGIPYKQIEPYQSVIGRLQSDAQNLSNEIGQLQTQISILTTQLSAEYAAAASTGSAQSPLVLVLFVSLVIVAIIAIKQRREVRKLQQRTGPDAPTTVPMQEEPTPESVNHSK